MEHEKSSFYKLQPRSPNSKPEEYVILTSSVEQEEMIATKLFISKSNFDQIEAQNFGDWVWLMAQLSFCSNDGKSLSRVEIKLQGVPPFNAYIPNTRGARTEPPLKSSTELLHFYVGTFFHKFFVLYYYYWKVRGRQYKSFSYC